MATFRDLLTNYQAAERCQGPFSDQCAIKIGIALAKSGISLASYQVARCWNDSVKHMLRAEELAAWIRIHPFAGRGGTGSLDPKTFQDQINGKTGIVFFNRLLKKGLAIAP